MNLRTKIVGAFGLLIALSTAGQLFTGWRLRETSKLFNANENYLTATRAVSDAHLMTVYAHRAEKAHTIEDDFGTLQQYEAWIQADDAQLKKDLATLHQLGVMDDEAHRALQAFETAWPAWLEANQKVLSLSRDGRKVDAQRVSNTASQKAFAAATEPLDQLVGIIAKRSEGVAATYRQHFQTTLQLSLILLVGIGLVSVLIGLVLAGRLSRPLLELAGAMRKAKDGDLRATIPVRTNDEIGLVTETYNDVTQRLAETIKALQATVDRLNHSSHDLSNVSTKVSQQARELSDVAQQVATGSEEQAHLIGNSHGDLDKAQRLAQEAANLAVHVAEVTTDAVAQAARGRQELEEVQRGMATIVAEEAKLAAAMATQSELVGQIKKAAGQIERIANQTNLLALNATIEAARAGEEGRGFTIVASEIRALAEEVKATSASITQLTSEVLGSTETLQASVAINRTQVDVQSRDIQQAADVFSQIAAAVADSGAVGRQIASVNQNLAELTNNATSGFTRTLEISETAVAGSEELSAMAQFSSSQGHYLESTAEALREVVGELTPLIARFTVDDGPSPLSLSDGPH